MSRCAVGVGSNLGDRLAHLRAAVDGLAAVVTYRSISSVYETAPIGGPDQGPFLNAVVVIDTAQHTPRPAPRTPRDRTLAWTGSRHTVGSQDARSGPASSGIAQTISEPGLTVPHPRMLDRRFVLEPLLEVWPDARMPDGSAICARRQDAVERQGLERVAGGARRRRSPTGRSTFGSNEPRGGAGPIPGGSEPYADRPRGTRAGRSVRRNCSKRRRP